MYRFISDPGHGWLEVPNKEILELNIGHKISGFSYQNGSKSYLEEDCDASIFLRAMTQAGRKVVTKNIYQEKTPIRNFHRFQEVNL